MRFSSSALETTAIHDLYSRVGLTPKEILMAKAKKAKKKKKAAKKK